MRILMASDFYSPYIGGAERQLQILSQELVARGHDVSVATVWQKGLTPTQDINGVGVHRLKGLSTALPWFSSDPKRRFHPPFPDPRLVLALRALIRKLKPDLVHACGWIAYSCAAALLGNSTPLIVSTRDYGYSCATKTLLNRGTICSGPALSKCIRCSREQYGLPKAAFASLSVFSAKWLLRRKVQAVHTNSSYVGQVDSRDLFHHRPIKTITNIILPAEANTHYPQEKQLEQLPAEPFILFVGALQKHKGISAMLDAYERLPTATKIPLVIIGARWPHAPPIPPNVTVFYNMPHQFVMDAWKRSLFGVVPSAWAEPLPNVILEAMQSGKTLVATQVGGIPDLVTHEQNGLLVQLGDIDGLSCAMQRLIDDPNLRRRLEIAAKDSIKRNAPETILPRFEQLYAEVSTRAGKI